MKLHLLRLILCLLSTPVVHAGFNLPCADHGTQNGEEPDGAPRFYKIHQSKSGQYTIKPQTKSIGIQNQKIFKLIIEDLQFTTYKCWDRYKNLTGFDIELMTHVIGLAGYSYIQFVPVTWEDITVDNEKQLSLLFQLNQGLGDAVSAGMSITDERKKHVSMIGPIYKAGKKLMSRKDNIRVSTMKMELLNLPSNDYQKLAGLRVLVQSGTIRSDFFKELSLLQPELIEYGKLIGNQVHWSGNTQKLLVVETEADTLETYTNNKMVGLVYGIEFDLVMVDTGSMSSLISTGLLGENADLEIVTGNLGADPQLGFVFGLGDGVSFRKNDSRISQFTKIIAKSINQGFVDHLVEKWFQDDNAADPTWAKSY